MNKNKLLRVAMLLSLLAPTAESMTVLAQDVMLETHKATTNETSDSSSKEENNKNAAPTTSDKTDQGPLDASAETNSNSLVNADDKKRSDSSQSAIGSSDNKAEAENQVDDKSTDHSKPTDQPKPSPSKVDTAPASSLSKQLPEARTPIQSLSPYVSDLDLSEIDIPSVNTYAAYVEHWSGKNAYTHHLLSRRYGIKADQIDSYLKSTGIAYDSTRINGEKLLQWEKKSGLDVRAIVAIAMSESSLGTQGIATLLGANMFGYAAFDLDPTQASKFNDDSAIVKMTQDTIIKNKNSNFALQDLKAAKFSRGQLNFASDGGVYFTDTTGSGKRRAQIMEDLDKWIDDHGGTPAIPAELKVQSSASFASVPAGYKLSKSYDVLGYQASSYAWGQCTWYVYNRAKELGYQFDPFMGNGGDWKYKVGYALSKTPKVGYAISFAPGQAGADGTYGHVSIVEDVRKDGSILISESNCIGLGKISYRTFTAQQAEQLTYVIGKSKN
ncbi:TPA: CHAP domain-containing protein [Streptococcus pyogenes]|uniref:CHAP domain-containing protein n=1 Tax=Streptococcus pyogenes TaxID=1314 RepID=UPI000447FE2B|nr:CHAP domain-containing protein [Streptococcus pyogenes]HEQ1636087.1 CHAP domain-containing protein [Streptococcus pyogenes ABC020051380]HER4813719.1 CHAP domain-containing protein [Streptococcus pyogenes NGAS056]EZM69666.1 hypothetical protein Z226_01518 [Streptococcus pyogenes ABC020052313]HEQ9894314.1 CHAP domain-containing protein [Streptococcus pyogenes]HER0201623.1 CHAP domain-containing protein [Streptococcus pyogenes]